jgi:ABC-type Fe3+/spermidine/putrescine transport system ATPase subunit
VVSVHEADASDGERFLAIAAVEKQFDQQPVLRRLELTIEQGEFFTLLGPSGCGKTTLLRIIGGFEQATSGTVSFRGVNLTGVPPERRPFNMVFQSYALFPHMSVAGNVGYGLRTAGLDRVEITRKVSKILELVHLDADRGRSVLDLSGGQQQRVALARALVNEPEVLLLDEPLGALDLKLRRRLQEELRAIQSRLATTFVYVTHDQEEALTMSHRIGVMQDGRLIQVGNPREVYERPASQFVAQFVGETNLLPCEVIAVGGPRVAAVRFASGEAATLPSAEGLRLQAGDRAMAMIRPEHLELARDDSTFSGTLRESVFLGTHVRHVVDVGGGRVMRVLAAGDVAPPPGEEVRLRIAEGKGMLVAPEPSAHAESVAVAEAPSLVGGAKPALGAPG